MSDPSIFSLSCSYKKRGAMDRTLNLPFGVESGTLDVTVKVYRNLMPSTRTTSRLLEVTIPPPHFLVRNAHTADRL